MRTLSRLNTLIPAAALWLGCSISLAQPPIEQLLGTYVGEVYNGTDMDPMTTTFRLEAGGRLGGEYHVDEETGAYSGVLSSVVFEDARTISFEWTDKFGEGFAVLEFSRDYSSFTGAWSDKLGNGEMPWNGRKRADPN